MKKHPIILVLLITLFASWASAQEEIKAFESVGSHSWDVPGNVEEVDVLVVGAGGSGDGGIGGDWWGSGGGGGEVILKTNYSVTDENIDIVIGDGGTAPTEAGPNSPPSEDGENSKFGNIVAEGGQGGQETEGGASGSGNPGGEVQGGSEPDRGGAGGGGQGENGSDMPVGVYGGGDGGDGIYQQEVNGKTYNFSDLFGTSHGEKIGKQIWFGGGGAGFDGDNAGFGKPGKGGGGGEEGLGSSDSDKRFSSKTDGIENTGGGGAERRRNGDGGSGGSGIVLIRYNAGVPICDKRGLLDECISNSTHEVSGEKFNISSIFQSESTSVFEAFNGKATFNLTNKTTISGLWKGSIDILAKRPIIQSGASFRPQGERITIGN